jgi:hypothetical protein
VPSQAYTRAMMSLRRDCHMWNGHIGTHGYGTLGRTGLAHRAAYEQAYGPIPDGLQIDHLCRIRACVNPAHLEAVTQRENILRGESPAAKAARSGHCSHGHEYTPENTYVRKDGGGRQCRRCKADRMRRAR